MHETPRVHGIGPTDRTSEQRTPRERLLPIPAVGLAGFTPLHTELPALRAGENDLTRLSAGRQRAAGEAIEIIGSVRDAAGKPQAGVLVEVWNANSFGRYAHVADDHDYPLDPLFLGEGRGITGLDGGFRFWTVMPGHYIARPDINRWRPAHIHFSVRGGGSRLITQMYFDGDPYNDTDPMRVLMGADFVRQIGVPSLPSSQEVSRAFRFDIVLGRTYFEQPA
ncbi:hypothetical protein D5S17_08020 [Pseudonocardiaceae bacterium YIM PH 21723]|nr:hypothetical protein D5S17_08020 [Pseudonocardiaceae bacterium YIM PH 21723]